MEVVNTDVFQPTEHLIGQQNQTLSFGVSSDPALMAMLSTGLYTYPHRTMIQELLFNAWDAHKMVGKTDVPLDVYINSTSGLIVRDYGPGIEPGEGDSEIHGTYCIYGYSSKRANKNQTGGFGLGSKSPFAYTESFTVTSFWGGMKNVYLIRRVAEDQNGRPGFTPLMKIPSDETGLMVVIPLKSGDMQKTREAIYDISFRSGLKINLHFEDQNPELIDTEVIAPGTFEVIIEDELPDSVTRNNQTSKVMAVLGGVRYEIPVDDAYYGEINFIYNLIQNNEVLLLGFAPGTIVPTPNRENLNLNDKTKEAIKQAFEIFQEKFIETVAPMAKSYIQVVSTMVQKETKDPISALFRMLLIGHPHVRFNKADFKKTMKSLAPKDTQDASIWFLGLNLINDHTSHFLDKTNTSNWYLEILRGFSVLYPEHIEMVTLLRQHPQMQRYLFGGRKKHIMTVSEVTKTMSETFGHAPLVKLDKTIRQWNQENSGSPAVMRTFNEGTGWVLGRFERPFHDTDDRRQYNPKPSRYGKKGIHRTPKYNTIYQASGGRENKESYSSVDPGLTPKNFIIIANTVKLLDEIRWHEVDVFLGKNKYFGITNRYYGSQEVLITQRQHLPAIVVNNIRNGFERAVKFFESQGYKVFKLQAPAVIKPLTPVPKKPKKPEGFLVLDPNKARWFDGVHPHTPPELLIEKPEYFFYRTQFDVSEYSSKSTPPSDIITEWLKMFPKTVVVNNAVQAKKLLADGVKDFDVEIETMTSTWFPSSEDFKNAVYWLELKRKHPYLETLLNFACFRKEMGIQFTKTNNPKVLEDLMKRITMIEGSSYKPLQNLSRWVKLNRLVHAPDLRQIGEKMKMFHIFDWSIVLDNAVKLPEDQREAFFKKVIKTAKTLSNQG